MRNLLLTISYVGTNYHGFQIQRNAVTVQDVFQRALFKVLGSPLPIKGCSRTDAGVHAREYCVSFHTGSDIACERLIRALNFHLPRDIRALSAREVKEDFHARYSCEAKRYVYLVYNSKVFDPFLEGRAYWFAPNIKEDVLSEAALNFLGKHDFRPFSGNKRSVEDTVRTVSAFSVERERNLVVFSVTADGFLYNMARIMAGTLLSVARGALESDGILRALESGVRDRRCFTAPAHGLYLDRVYYE